MESLACRTSSARAHTSIHWASRLPTRNAIPTFLGLVAWAARVRYHINLALLPDPGRGGPRFLMMGGIGFEHQIGRYSMCRHGRSGFKL